MKKLARIHIGLVGLALLGFGGQELVGGRVGNDGDGEGLLKNSPLLVGAADADAVGGPGAGVEGVGGQQLVAADREGGVVGRAGPGGQGVGEGVAAAGLLLAYEHSIVSPSDMRRLNAAFFTMNGVIAMVFLVFVAADVWLRR